MPAPFTRLDPRALTLAAGVLACSALAAPPAWSHGIQSNLEKLTPLSQQVRREFLVQSEFSTGEPAGEAAVRLWRPDGETIEMGRTDASGSLRFAMPDELSDEWEIQVDAGPGHRDYLELSEATGGPSPETAPLAAGRTGLGRLLAGRAGGPGLPLVGGLAMGLAASGALLLRRRRG